MSGLIDRINGVIADTALKNPCVVVATSAIQLQGLQTIEGVTLQDGDRVLVAGQTDSIQNGVYESRAANWNRAPDMDGLKDIVRGTLVRVLAPASAWWELQTIDPVIDTTPLNFTEFFSAGGGPGGSQGTTRYYILAINGAAITPNTPTLTLQARMIDENGDAPVTSGNVKLYANGQEVTEANGFGPGSNGYTGVFDDEDITNSVVVQLRDDVLGKQYDAKTLVDESPIPIVVISASPDLTFYKAANGGPWDSTSSVLTIEVYQNGAVIESAEVTVTLNTGTGTLNAVETTSNADISISVLGQDSASITVIARHLPSGNSEAEQLYAIQGGDAGTPGVSAYSASLTRPVGNVSAASDGTGFDLTNEGGQFIVRQGASIVTSGVVYSVLGSATVDGLTIAIDSSGNYALSGAWTTDSAEFTLRAVVAGLTFDLPYKITKSRAGLDGGVGSQPVVVRKTYSNGRQWTRALNAGAWQPLSTTTDVDFEWKQGATLVASIKIRFTLNTSTGNITGAVEGAPTGGATATFENNGTAAATADVVASGVEGSATIISTQSGSDGLPGVSGLIEGVGTGAVGNITFAANTPSVGLLRITGDVLFLKNGTKYNFSGPIDLNGPSGTLDPLYIIVGANTAASRFGAGFSSSNFFAATYDAGSKQWAARGSTTENVSFSPALSDAVICITSTSNGSINAIASVINPMIFDSQSIGFFVQNGAIVNALIDSVAANKISAGTIAANLIQTGLLEIDGNGRLVMDTGASKLMMGAGFGSTGQFTLWYGPSVVESAMTEANATFYLKTDGSAYFGGALSAGTLTTSGQTSSTLTDAEIEIGPYGSNGGVITVTHSYQFTQQGRSNNASNNPPTQIAPQATLVLERSINNGAYSIVATRNLAGGFGSLQYDPEILNQWFWTEFCSGSFTYTDNAQLAQDRKYRWRLTSRTNTTIAVNRQQNLTVTSAE